MIESLTPQQEAKLSTYKEKWFKIGLSTEPCNVPQTKKWINKAYKNAGLELPKEYKLFDSPLSCAKYQSKADLSNPILDLVSNQVRDQVREQVSD